MNMLDEGSYDMMSTALFSRFDLLKVLAQFSFSILRWFLHTGVVIPSRFLSLRRFQIVLVPQLELGSGIYICITMLRGLSQRNFMKSGSVFY